MINKDQILSVLKSSKNELSSHGVRNIGLFGSYIRNEQRDGSDIDFLIDFDPNAESFDNFMAVYDILEALFQGEKIEVVTVNGLSPYIGPSILREVAYV
jgi:hypothetical protein